MFIYVSMKEEVDTKRIIKFALNQGKKIFVPKINNDEAAVVPKLSVYPIESLLELVRFLSGTIKVDKSAKIKLSTLLKTAPAEFDFQEIIGQEHAKRAMEISAAGSHNIFLKGNPGSGKNYVSKSPSRNITNTY